MEDFPAIWNISQPFLNIFNCFWQVFKNALRTDGRTDEASDRDAWTHLKTGLEQTVLVHPLKHYMDNIALQEVVYYYHNGEKKTINKGR